MRAILPVIHYICNYAFIHYICNYALAAEEISGCCYICHYAFPSLWAAALSTHGPSLPDLSPAHPPPNPPPTLRLPMLPHLTRWPEPYWTSFQWTLFVLFLIGTPHHYPASSLLLFRHLVSVKSIAPRYKSKEQSFPF